MNRPEVFALIASTFFLTAGCSNHREPSSEPTSNIKAMAKFGRQLALTDYSIGTKQGHTEIEFHWTTLQKPSADFIVFVHALDSGGAVVFQGDHYLKNAAGLSTGGWNPEDSVVDRFQMAPSGNHPPGSYTLRIGVWEPKTPTFLKIMQTSLPQPTDGWKGRAFLIENVECK